MNNIYVEFKEQYVNVYVGDVKIGTIGFKINPFHNQNRNLDLQFEYWNLDIVKHVFDILREKVKEPLQLMIPSTDKALISFVNVTGFVCKRKCYEVDAYIQDYVGRNIDYSLACAEEGQIIYGKCCDMMLDRYILTHKDISPWTGTKSDFYKNLPKTIYYDASNDEVKNFAFLEDNEIAYVYGTDKDTFGIFAEALITKLFRKFEHVTFEADDCDDYAMQLKSFFINQSDESYNTYIL